MFTKFHLVHLTPSLQSDSYSCSSIVISRVAKYASKPSFCHHVAPGHRPDRVKLAAWPAYTRSVLPHTTASQQYECRTTGKRMPNRRSCRKTAHLCTRPDKLSQAWNSC